MGHQPIRLALFVHSSCTRAWRTLSPHDLRRACHQFNALNEATYIICVVRSPAKMATRSQSCTMPLRLTALHGRALKALSQMGRRNKKAEAVVWSEDKLRLYAIVRTKDQPRSTMLQGHS